MVLLKKWRGGEWRWRVNAYFTRITTTITKDATLMEE